MGLGGAASAAMDMIENVVFKGNSLIVTKSSDSSTGYKNVIKLRTTDNGPVYVAKFKVDGEPGQRNVPKSYSRSPQEAAAALAYFEAGYTWGRCRSRRSTRSVAPPKCVQHLLSQRMCAFMIDRRAVLVRHRKQQGRTSRARSTARRRRGRRALLQVLSSSCMVSRVRPVRGGTRTEPAEGSAVSTHFGIHMYGMRCEQLGNNSSNWRR